MTHDQRAAFGTFVVAVLHSGGESITAWCFLQVRNVQCRGLRATLENSALSYVDSRFSRTLLLLVAPVCREGRGESASQRLLRREREN